MVAAASAGALLVGELITLVQTVALARLLSPSEVGLFVAGTVLTTFLTNFVEGGLRSGLVHREDSIEDAAETVFRVTLLSGFAMSLGALALSPVIGMIFDNRTAGLVAAATSGSLLLFAFTNVPEAMLQRQFSVKRRVIVGPTVSLTFAVVAVAFAARGWGVWSMVIGSYASFVAWVLGVWLICDWRPGRGTFSFRMWRELARYGFPLLLGLVGARLKIMAESVIIGRGLSEAALGQYRYAQRIAEIPERVIIEVGAIALFPAFSRIAGDPERLRSAFLRALRFSMIGAVALTALMLALGEPAVVIVFGEPWREAGAAVVAMAGVGVGKAVASVSEEAIKGAGRTTLINWCTATELGLGLILLIALIGPFELIGVGLAVSITAITVAILELSLAVSVIGVPIKELLGAIAPPFPAAAVGFAVTLFLEHEVLHSDAHSLLIAVGMLVLDTLTFTVVYLLVFAVVAPATVKQLFAVSGRLLRKLTGRAK